MAVCHLRYNKMLGDDMFYLGVCHGIPNRVSRDISCGGKELDILRLLDTKQEGNECVCHVMYHHDITPFSIFFFRATSWWLLYIDTSATRERNSRYVFALALACQPI